MNKKQQEFIDLKNQWLNFFNNDRFGKHRKLFDWVKYTSSQIPAPQEPEDTFNCFNPFKKIAVSACILKKFLNLLFIQKKALKITAKSRAIAFTSIEKV